MALNISNKLDVRIVYRNFRAKFGVSGSHNCRDLCVDTGREIYRQTDEQTCRQTNRQTDGQTA